MYDCIYVEVKHGFINDMEIMLIYLSDDYFVFKCSHFKYFRRSRFPENDVEIHQENPSIYRIRQVNVLL